MTTPQDALRIALEIGLRLAMEEKKRVDNSDFSSPQMRHMAADDVQMIIRALSQSAPSERVPNAKQAEGVATDNFEEGEPMNWQHVPDGWKLVPKKLTEEQYNYVKKVGALGFPWMYEAAVDAAPSQPADKDQS